MPFHPLKSETIQRLQQARVQRQVDDKQQSKLRWMERIANYERRGWTELVQTERELFMQHFENGE